MGNIIFKLFHIGWVVLAFYLGFFQEIDMSWLERIIAFLLFGGFPTYYLFKSLSSGGYFDPEYFADDVLDDDFGGE